MGSGRCEATQSKLALAMTPTVGSQDQCALARLPHGREQHLVIADGLALPTDKVNLDMSVDVDLEELLET